MEDIDNRLSIVEKNTTKILFILESDSKLNSKGLVETVQDTKKDVDMILLQRQVERARNGIFGALGGFVVMVLYVIITAIVNQKIK